MSRSNDAGHFFQTSDALASTERKAAKSKNKYGKPIKLPSKILNLAADPTKEDCILTAEAAGTVSSVNLETSQITKVMTEPVAPVTSVAVASSKSSQTLLAGCWDKTIYQKSLNASLRSKTTSLPHTNGGHTDFVKCLLATSLSNVPILISGGADASIIIWQQDSTADGGIASFTLLHKLKGHTKSLQDLAIDPLSLPEGSSKPNDSFILFSASSDREIRRWHVSLQTAHELQASIDQPILAHETSIYKLHFDSEGDLWTASADKTAKHLVRDREWEADTTLSHPDFVRDVVVQERLGLVVTACRDEEVRVWDCASGDLVCTYSGHYEEVTGLLLLASMKEVASVSIDGTLRRWGLERADMDRYREEVERDRAGEDESAKAKGNVMTAEEEAELAELMDEDA